MCWSQRHVPNTNRYAEHEGHVNPSVPIGAIEKNMFPTTRKIQQRQEPIQINKFINCNLNSSGQSDAPPWAWAEEQSTELGRAARCSARCGWAGKNDEVVRRDDEARGQL